MDKIIIGITGGIASGKSSFLSFLKKYRFKTLSADEIVSSLYKKDGLGYKALKALRIKGTFDSDGNLNKKKVRDLIFRNKTIRNRVEKVIHPLVIKEIKDFIKGVPKGSLACVEIPLLFEADKQELCTYTATIYTPETQMIKTLRERYSISAKEAEKMLGTHMDITQKMMRSDIVIFNTGSLKTLQDKAGKLAVVLNKIRGVNKK